jgi:hypothetical protein
MKLLTALGATAALVALSAAARAEDIPPLPPSGEAAVSPVDEFARLRRGVHLGASVGFTSVLNPIEEGATGSFVVNWGVGSHVDLRASLRLSAGGGLSGYGPDGIVEVPLSVRFNFGSVYTMAMGFAAGTLILSGSDCIITVGGVTASCGRQVKPYPLFGPELTFTSFRAGPKREIEIELLAGLGVLMWSNLGSSQTELYPRFTVSTTYLFL